MNKIKSGIFIAYIILINFHIVLGQPSHEILLDAKYEKSKFNPEIDNSGVYCISHFKVENEKVLLYDFNEPILYEYRNNVFAGESKINDINLFRYINRDDSGMERIRLSKKGNDYSTIENDPDEIEIIVNSKSDLDVTVQSHGFNISFPGDLAYADLIGISKNDICFLLVERYIQEVPLLVSREVYTTDKNGEVLSVLKLPDIKYLYTIKDLEIDSRGNLYHMLTTEKGIEVFKWSGLEKRSEEIIQYPDKYNYSLHYNNFLPAHEPKTSIVVNSTLIASRPMSLRIAEGYVYHQYYCRGDNLAPSNVTAPDGDIVRTPGRLIVGMNARVPYKWGGFSTLDQFDYGISTGKYAGDIHTDGVSSSAVGVDCSGFVSRCWQLSYHASTSFMPNITTQYSSWSDLKPGDAVHKVGHVRLYISTEQNGGIKIVESTSRGWGVSYWTYAPSDLTAYTPRYHNEMSDDYFENQPRLLSVSETEENLVKIQWTADNTDVLGYRLYRSQDRKTWTLIFDETTLTDTYAVDTLSSGIYYYRVSCLKDNDPYYSESDLSNEMGIGKYSSEKKCLIIDGFDRESGSWRGDGHKFAGRYAASIAINNIDFESRKSSELFADGFDINNYDYLFWISGDESTVDETLNSFEQALIKEYFENGGNLFISGSEIGWDLDNRGSTGDKNFYNNYLKAEYKSDDAGAPKVNGVNESVMEGCSFQIGQTYDEDYPDEISPFGGSELCMKYSNNKGAGIEYSGSFGSSEQKSNLIYLGFPLETTADNTEFNLVIKNAVDYFNESIVSVEDVGVYSGFRLEQNYPNPFNPATKIQYYIPVAVPSNVEGPLVTLMIYDLLGKEVTTLFNEKQRPGNYEIIWDAGNYPSGIYFYQLTSGNFVETKKMILLR